MSVSRRHIGRSTASVAAASNAASSQGFSFVNRPASPANQCRRSSQKPSCLAPRGSRRRPAHQGRVLVPRPLAAAALAAAAAACCQTCCCSLRGGGGERSVVEQRWRRQARRRRRQLCWLSARRAAQGVPFGCPPVMCATEAMLGPWRPLAPERAAAQSRAGCRPPPAAATALLRATRGRRSAGCAAAVACILWPLPRGLGCLQPTRKTSPTMDAARDGAGAGAREEMGCCGSSAAGRQFCREQTLSGSACHAAARHGFTACSRARTTAARRRRPKAALGGLPGRCGTRGRDQTVQGCAGGGAGAVQAPG